MYRDDRDLKKTRASQTCPHHQVTEMKTTVNSSKTGHAILAEFKEGFSTYKIAIPMSHAVSFFLEGLLISLGALTQKKSLQVQVSSKQGQKAEIQEKLRHVIHLYDQFLNDSGR